MKNLLFILLFFIICNNSAAQLINIKSDTLSVNYDKTLHLIFPSNIQYFTSVDEFVVVDNPGEAPWILRIKSNQRNFTKPTNVSAATSDGQFYDFIIFYNENSLISNIFLPEKASISPETILVNNLSQTHLLFPDVIRYTDYGSPDIEIEQANNTQNILRVKGLLEGFTETNISVVTNDKKFYTYNIRYSQENTTKSYFVDKPIKPEENVILSVNELTDRDREEIRKKIEQFPRNIFSLGQKKDGILFSVNNIFIHQNFLFFKLSINNRSAIPFDIDYLKFNIVDKKKQKLTASQEIEQQSIYIDNYKTYIEPYKENVFIVGYEKFTIPDQKTLKIEINEKNGGRHINFHLENKDIINGEIF
jgi:Bacteroides conjugative transposon TraN protein